MTRDQADTRGDSVSVSGPGRFASRVHGLIQSNPASAKEMLGKLAAKVRAQAANATGDEAKRMSAFAEKLEIAASTGDLSALAPPAKAAPQAPPPQDAPAPSGPGPTTEALLATAPPPGTTGEAPAAPPAPLRPALLEGASVADAPRMTDAASTAHAIATYAKHGEGEGREQAVSLMGNLNSTLESLVAASIRG